MKKYSSLWTQFETQSLAFGLLRKALYPKYLVRGEFGKIHIFEARDDKDNPTYVLTINVHASTTKDEDGWFHANDNDFNLVGGQSAYNVVMNVVPELNARGRQNA